MWQITDNSLNLLRQCCPLVVYDVDAPSLCILLNMPDSVLGLPWCVIRPCTTGIQSWSKWYGNWWLSTGLHNWLTQSNVTYLQIICLPFAKCERRPRHPLIRSVQPLKQCPPQSLSLPCPLILSLGLYIGRFVNSADVLCIRIYVR